MVESLLELPIPELSSSQVSAFTRKSLRTKEVGPFNPVKAMAELIDGKVVGIDIGGDTISAQLFQVTSGKITGAESYSNRSINGRGYLTFLEQAALKKQWKDLPVGLSFAGEVKDGLTVGGFPNLRALERDLERYQGDFRRLFPTLKGVTNDAVAGLMAGALESVKRGHKNQNVLYIINGSGFGGAILKDGIIYAIEPGHVEAQPPLDRVREIDGKFELVQTKPCKTYGDYVCLENVVASRAGIEDLWYKRFHDKADGREISSWLDVKGEEAQFALGLYNTSAVALANAIVGMSEVFKLFDGSTDTVIVCHGGTFKVPKYGDRLRQISEEYLGIDLKNNFILTHQFSPNACLEGAAIVASLA